MLFNLRRINFMNFKKTIACAAAAAVTAVSLASVAGAELVEIDDVLDANGLELLDSTANSWMPIAYYDGTRPKIDPNKAVVDYGVDWSQAKSIEVVFSVSEGTREDWDGAFGGAVVVSSNSPTDASHNWPAYDFWGVTDEALEIDTYESAKSLQLQKIADYTYKLDCPIDSTNNVVDNPQLVQIAIQDWSGVTWWTMDVVSMTVKDASGNALIAWDQAGKCSLSPVGAASAAVEEAPAAEETAAPAEETAAPAEEAAPAAAEVTAAPAPATGDVAAATDSTKGSPNTGIEDVAVVAGLALVAGGALVVAKKRK